MMKGFKPEGSYVSQAKLLCPLVQYDHEGSLINYTDFVTSSLQILSLQ